MTKSKIPEPSIFSNNKQLLLQLFSLKYFYIGCTIVFVTIAFLYNKYSTKKYEVFAFISQVNNERSAMLVSNDLFRGLQSFQSYNDIENEINNINSFSQISNTISRLNLEIGYYSENFKLFKETSEISNNAPFSVLIDKSHLQPINAKFYIQIINDTSFRLTLKQNRVSLFNYIDNNIINDNKEVEIDTICKFNETLINHDFKFSVSFNKEHYSVNARNKLQFYFEFYNLDVLTKEYLKSLVVSRVSPASTILRVQLSGENVNKSILFLNKYLTDFFEDNLSKKNKIAVSTINFIDSQISNISDSLVLAESKLKNFRSTNQITNLSYQGQMLYEQLQNLALHISDLKTQERYYSYIIDYLKKDIDVSGVVPPSAMNVQDPIINNLISDLQTLNSERSNIIKNRGEKNIFLGEIENKIGIKKQDINENANNNLNTLNLTLNELNYREDKLSKEISNLPNTEMNMVSIQRKFNLNDAIYTYLLQKRSEAAITMASNYPDFEITEPAREITSRTVAPKTMFNYLIALLFGLAIPTIYLIAREFFNNKIQNVHFIEHLINRSVIGTIYSSNKKSEAVIIDYPLSSISESFRNLRSNLIMKLRSPSAKIIILTSSQPRDGKSFIAFNLAVSIASIGKKTLIIDGDLRRPTIHNKIKLDNSSGLSNYMINKASINEIIMKTSVNNLSFIPAGPQLPNPPELIEAGVLDELIDFVKKEYEYIIIDTTPLAIVTDAVLLMRYATQILVIARNNYTRRDILANAIDILDLHKFENYEVVYNDINMNESPYKSYSNYYIKEKDS